MNDVIKKKSLLQESFSEHGRIPPQAVDIEEVVLGAAMLETSAYKKISPILSMDSFYKESHQKIFNALFILDNKNEPIDTLTVVNQLKASGELEVIGGAYYVVQLTNKVSSTAHIEYHATIIKQKYIQREIIRHCSELIKDSFEDTSDVIELVEKFQLSSSEISEKIMSGRLNIEHISNITVNSIYEMKLRIDNYREGKMTGIPTPFKKLNIATGGWINQNLIVLAARPGMGKTAVALAFAKKAALSGYKGSFFSLEMSKYRLIDRLLISGSGVDAERFRNGWLDNNELDRVFIYGEELKKMNLWIDDSPYVGLDHIKATARIQKSKGNLDYIMVDYLQLMEPGKNYKGNREGEVSQLSRGLKGIAKELDVPLIIVAQLNREVEKRPNKKPILADLRESGAIEQDADMVLFLYRPEYYGIMEDESGNSLSGIGFIIIAKHREGALIDIPFRYNNSLTILTDYTNEEPVEYYKKGNDPF